MTVVPALLVWLTLATAVPRPSEAGGPAPGAARGYRPSGAPEELVDLGLLARLRDPRIRPLGCCGWLAGSDRFHCPGARGGSVVAEFAGPGIVQRIRLTDPDEGPGRPERPDRLKIYLDGRAAPAVDVAIEDLAAGRHPHFPRPLVGRAAGGLSCYVPIAFRDGCRIILDGPGAARRRARVGGVALPDASGITPFRAEPTPAERAQLERAVAAWSRPEELIASDHLPIATSEYTVDGIARNTHRFLLPPGPRTIRSLEIEVAPGTSDAWRAARLRLRWEALGGAAGVDLPLGFAFARLPGAEPCRSLLMGQKGSVWSHRFPMPYRRQASLQVDSETAIRGTIRVRSVPGVAPDAAYFRAAYRAIVGARPAVAAEAFELSGRGHFAGILIAASHPPERSDRPAGDLCWAISGLGAEIAIHRSPSRPAGWDTSPAQGLFLGPGDPASRSAAAYRWHAADPIPFVRPLRAMIEPHEIKPPPADSRAAVAVFWYSERPGPDPDGP